MFLVPTELSSPFTINSCVGPIIWPEHFLGFSHRKDRLNRESHSSFAYSHCLILAIMGYPRRRMKLSVDPMASPGCYDTAVSGLGMLLDHGAELPYRRAGFYKLDRLIQAFPCRFDHPYRVWVRLGSITHIVCFVEISMITLMVD